MATRVLRPIRIEGNIAYVPLTKGYEAIIDAADVEIVAKGSWYANDKQARHLVYAYRNIVANGVKTKEAMHRAIFSPAPGEMVDHINGNPLDNRRANLRRATKAQNQTNTRMRSNNKSGIRGVYWRPDTRKWSSQIRYNGRVKTLGSFDTIKAAAAAYRDASMKLHGEFSPLASRVPGGV